ncbi:MAG: branched-chain amino acid ABC transporter permease [Candidatus Tectomicrobia bacterium]|uniref:Branched-chain amino acid ABC transporter permease n=1 Tax=Tectimicrobiota bacterium TaxID=2528274 RepID=A0A933GLS2_UNCTE|nr:branched-chain amino acid ABC transporter permease [Candidatus Tectomicrobia bacterium]
MEYWISVLSLLGIHMLMALSVYVIMSTGQVTFGQQGFFAIGAYLSAFATAMWGLSLTTAFILAGLVSSLFGVLVGFPALRIRGFYLAITTLAFAEIVRLFFLNLTYQRQIGDRLIGPDGAHGFRYIDYLVQHQITLYKFLGIIYLIVAIFAVFFILLGRSRLGPAFKAVEEDEMAASMLGLNITTIKLSSFIIGAFIAGVAGGLYAHYMQYVGQDFFGVNIGVYFMAYVMIGGLGSFVGPMLGATMLVGLTEILRFLQEYRMIFYGALIIATVIFRPRGIIDEALIFKIKTFLKKKAFPLTAGG